MPLTPPHMAVTQRAVPSWPKRLWGLIADMVVARGHKQDGPRLLVLACGALAKEIVALRKQLGERAANMELQCLPADFHNRPHKIAPAIDLILTERRVDFDHVLVGYGECGTGGELDKVLAKHHAERLPFAHCYEFFAGSPLFNQITEEEIGSFYLTDYLVRHFDRLVMGGLGLDRHPELRDLYFANYRRVVYLAQTRDIGLEAQAATAADKLGLAFDYRYVGYGELKSAIAAAAAEIDHEERYYVRN
ncbi:DUF1638 domain-containing protein [Maritalea mediterranea]|uniref:DUF1638 domain-containing protein n=1 Tax=Maritalea mediterranea TaxID=2909667 RepID=A0ABS9E6F8_9HYPH|nr:DUF1638 domain-containing protein [Maritalea mediterranea]MCF4098455.1 DUF1638 domain-containing protein [Maritalea mediterranea]